MVTCFRFSSRPVAISLLLVIALQLCLPVYGLEQYWVSVGSFSSRENANGLLNEVKQNTVETTQVRNLERPNKKGLYRVLVGPYLVKSDAHEQRLQLRIQYADAWVWAEDVPELDQQPSDTSSAVQIIDLESVQKIDHETLNTIPDVSVDLELEGELVDEPPPGYGLHKLRRNQ